MALKDTTVVNATKAVFKGAAIVKTQQEVLEEVSRDMSQFTVEGTTRGTVSVVEPTELSGAGDNSVIALC